jgi:hypothetical protein
MNLTNQLISDGVMKGLKGGIIIGGLIGTSLGGLGGAKMKSSADAEDLKTLTGYEQNIQIIKKELTADTYESVVGKCVENGKKSELGKILSINDIATALKKGVSIDIIAKTICK